MPRKSSKADNMKAEKKKKSSPKKGKASKSVGEKKVKSQSSKSKDLGKVVEKKKRSGSSSKSKSKSRIKEKESDKDIEVSTGMGRGVSAQKITPSSPSNINPLSFHHSSFSTFYGGSRVKVTWRRGSNLLRRNSSSHTS